jgi:hypothetical protein
MLLYQNKRDRFWSPTQAAAAAHKREIGGEFDQVEVPSVGRDALCDFLNHVQADAALDVEIASGVAEQPQPAAPAAAPVIDPAFEQAKARSRTASEIVDFILDEATVAQAGNILEALGTRFAELAKAARP